MMFYSSYLLVLFMTISVGFFSPDLVINSTVSYTWSSLVFIVTVDQIFPYDLSREACRLYSNIYCLQSFEIINEDFVPPFSAFVQGDWPSTLMYRIYWINKLANKECDQTFTEMFRRHNHFLDRQGWFFSYSVQFSKLQNMIKAIKTSRQKLVEFIKFVLPKFRLVLCDNFDFSFGRNK